MIADHQVLPGTITQALAARMEDSGKLSRSSSRLSLASSDSQPNLRKTQSASSLVTSEDTAKVTTVDIVIPAVEVVSTD